MMSGVATKVQGVEMAPGEDDARSPEPRRLELTVEVRVRNASGLPCCPSVFTGYQYSGA